MKISHKSKIVASSVVGLALATAMFTVLQSVGFFTYVRAIASNESFANYYTVPTVDTDSSQKLNLITVYMESIENAFSDSSLFGENLLAELDDVTSGAGWQSYRLKMYNGGGWTMAGLVGTQCGIPLKTQGVADLDAFTTSQSHYLEGASCLGNVLESAGYNNVFYGGADLEFAAKGNFLNDHGYSETVGLSEWKEAGATDENISWWGLSDAELFEAAQSKVIQLEESGEPFNFTILSLDSHEPGNVYTTCGDDSEQQMKRAIKCSMTAISQFIEFISNSGYLDNTVVVVMGDHLKQTGSGNNFTDELLSVDERTIFYRVHTPAGDVQFNRPGADQLSVFATTLTLLGLEPEDGRAGLGVSFVGDVDLEGTMVALPESEYEDLLLAPSLGLYAEFWGVAPSESLSG